MRKGSGGVSCNRRRQPAASVCAREERRKSLGPVRATLGSSVAPFGRYFQPRKYFTRRVWCSRLRANWERFLGYRRTFRATVAFLRVATPAIYVGVEAWLKLRFLA